MIYYHYSSEVWISVQILGHLLKDIPSAVLSWLERSAFKLTNEPTACCETISPASIFNHHPAAGDFFSHNICLASPLWPVWHGWPYQKHKLQPTYLFFRPVWSISFSKNIFVFENSYMITNFKFKIFIINVFIRINTCIIST